MDHQQQSLRMGAGMIACALLLRLAAAGTFQPVTDFLTKPNMAAFMLYLETGRIVRFSPSVADAEVFAGESAVPDFALKKPDPVDSQQPVRIPTFSAEDGALVEFKNSAGLPIDPEALICRPLQWTLKGTEPTVLILHTHATESYTKETEAEYEESAAFRTLDEKHNMISVGDRLAERLTAGGICVIHDRQLHDYPSYNGSYSNARKAIDYYLAEYPSICMVLDLHRDASEDLNNQMRTSADVDGKSSAQLMMVVGSNGTGLKHPNWQENLALAMKLQVQLQRLAPGICRKINLRGQRFNQDKSPGALLVEVGAAGNTRAEALVAIDVLAQAILDLAEGANTDVSADTNR